MQMHLQNTWEQVVFPGTYILKIRIYILHYSTILSIAMWQCDIM
jgi:hypothetical protein